MKIVSSLAFSLTALIFFSAALLAQGEAQGKKINEKSEKHEPAAKGMQVVVMKTSLGTIKIELNAEKAPITVQNFLKYVDEKYYDSTVFHRVIKNFMIQGGGFQAGKPIRQKRTHSPIKNESDNGLKNLTGTIAMARTQDPNSATSQFFINVADNNSLNRGVGDPNGYAVFGKVIEGMDVVEKIRSVKTGAAPAKALAGDQEIETTFQDVPETQVIVESVRRAGKK